MPAPIRSLTPLSLFAALSLTLFGGGRPASAAPPAVPPNADAAPDDTASELVAEGNVPKGDVQAENASGDDVPARAASAPAPPADAAPTDGRGLPDAPSPPGASSSVPSSTAPPSPPSPPPTEQSAAPPDGARQNEPARAPAADRAQSFAPEGEDDFLVPLDEGGMLLPAPERNATPDTAARLQNGGAPHFAIGASPAYAFRLHDDARSHGGGGHIYVDAPLLWGFGLELQVYGWGWGPTLEADRPLGLVGVAPLLIYSFDDSGIAAIAGVGPTLAAGFELADDGQLPWAPFAGGQFQFGLRFPLGSSTDIDVGIRVPIYIYGPEGFTLRSPFGEDRSQAGFFPAQVSLGIGVTFEPLAFIDAVRIDDDVFGGTLPHELFDFFL